MTLHQNSISEILSALLSSALPSARKQAKNKTGWQRFAEDRMDIPVRKALDEICRIRRLGAINLVIGNNDSINLYDQTHFLEQAPNTCDDL